MIPIHRASTLLALLTLLMPSLSQVAQAQSDTRKTFTLSGNAGAPDVRILGFPGEVVSSANGQYAASVPAGWSGAVIPVKEGYAFEPAQVAYERISENRAGQDYKAHVLTFTISGNVGLPGVLLQGLPGRVVTGLDGSYEVSVSYGWSGMVTPKKDGYVFNPTSMTYNKITKNQREGDYVAEVQTFSISGKVGLASVMLRGLPGDPVTDSKGGYAATVDWGWSGTVMPVKEGYTFTPPMRRYAPIMTGMVGQDYVAKVFMVTISDRIAVPINGVEEPIQGVTIKAEPGGMVAATDSQGWYRIEVPYGWSGTLTMSKPGFEFDPPSVTYTNVTEHIDRTAPKQPADIARPAPLDSVQDVLVIPTTGVEPERFGQIADDMRVMLDIFREKLNEPRTVSGVLYDYGDFFGHSGQSVQAMYIQGYAAIFMMRVDFPLSPTAQPQEQGQAQKEPADPVWQRARDRLYTPQGGIYRGRRAPGEADGKSFEQLKEDLLKSLKHAANIRNIDPNESVILTVIGQSESEFQFGGVYGGYATSSGSGSSSFSSGGSFEFSSSGGTTSTRLPRAGRRGPSARSLGLPGPATVLTIQAKKMDIDAFAKDQISFDQFSQKVKVFSY